LAAHRRLDAVTLEIVKDKLGATADEMGVVLARTSMSPIVYEVLDFACGLTDPEGQVLAQTNGLTLFTGTFGPQVRSVLARFPLGEMEPGDVFVTNDPYEGGTHICDVCLVAPVFAEARPIAFAVSITHWIETGGSVPGSIPVDATEIFQEGLRIPCLRLVHGGQEHPGLRSLIAANVRLPRLALSDLDAGLAAVRIGARRVEEVCARYSAAALAQAAAGILDDGERVTRAALRTIPNGVYRAEDVIDGNGVTDEDIPIRVEVAVADEGLTIDFTGSAPQTNGPVNCSWGALHSACKTVVRAVTSPQTRSNDGCFRPVTIRCPPGTVFTARPPAPTGWYYEASAFATELVWKALAPAVPERLGAGSYVSLSVAYVNGRSSETGELFVLAEPNDGGWGGNPGEDGESALIATTDGDTYNFPVEVVESRFPVLVQRYSLNTEAGGGAGRRRGGIGVVREYRVVNEGGATSYASMGGWSRRPWGLAGGRPGTNNYAEYVRPGHETIRHGRVRHVDLSDGDLVRVVTGTGGGFGDPFEREAERVRADVLDGYLTAAQARADYGVVLDPETLAVDGEATARLRGR
jgi:N-methylhydantoinase B